MFSSFYTYIMNKTPRPSVYLHFDVGIGLLVENVRMEAMSFQQFIIFI